MLIDMSVEPIPQQFPTDDPAVVFVSPDGGRRFDAFGSATQFKLEGSHTAGRLALALAVTPPGGGPPPHVHHSDDELFIIVEGELEVMTSAGWTRAGAGSVVYLPRNARHAFRNVGTTPSKHWVLTTPSGFDQFYARAAELFAAPTPPEPQQLRALAMEYGYEIFAPTASAASNPADRPTST
jgi:quercetin dioxygenase-like cupin family protein